MIIFSSKFLRDWSQILSGILEKCSQHTPTPFALHCNALQYIVMQISLLLRIADKSVKLLGGAF